MIFWWGNLSRESLCPKTQLDIWGNLAKAIWATWKTARKRSWQTKRLSSSLGSTILSTTTVFDIILKPSPDAVKGPKFSEANFGLLPTKLGSRKVEKRCFTVQYFVFYHVSREVSTLESRAKRRNLKRGVPVVDSFCSRQQPSQHLPHPGVSGDENNLPKCLLPTQTRLVPLSGWSSDELVHTWHRCTWQPLISLQSDRPWSILVLVFFEYFSQTTL